MLINFICAGCSALVVSLCYVFSGSWVFCLLALLPFLYRISIIDLAGSALSGVFFALSLVFVIFPANFFDHPLMWAANILLLFSVVVVISSVFNKLKRYFILSAILSAGICFPLEYLLKSGLEARLAFSIAPFDAGFMHRAVALLSVIFILFLIIAINSLLLSILGILIKLPFAGRIEPLLKGRIFLNDIKIIVLLKHWRCLPSLRAPPFAV